MDWTRRHIIGHGSTATVSLATSLHSDDVFAVKSTEFSQSQFLQKEGKILSSLSSSHIISYKGCDVTRENNKVMYNLFLEFMPDGTVIDVIRAQGGGGRLDESMIGYYTWQIVQGLDYLHSNGWVHCDIKGRNILVGEAGVKIADFGCAKPFNPVDIATPIGGGTPMFMAPEVARGEEQGFASDIWALGCTIIEMTTGGCAPWPNLNDPVSVLYRIGFSDQLPEFPCCLSEQGRDFLSKCLKRDPKQRWTAKQLLNHPFLGKFNSHVKQIQESNSTSSNSPTSILDTEFWNSMDESETENFANQVHTRHQSSASERIRRLYLISGGLRWDYDDDNNDENWITIRGNFSNRVMDEIEEKDDEVISYGSAYQESYRGQLLDAIRSRISEDDNFLFGGCKYGKDSVLVSSNDKDMLLIPYISTLHL